MMARSVPASFLHLINHTEVFTWPRRSGIAAGPSVGGGRPMDLGMIGLGRMGGNMAERLLRGGHRVVGYARRPEGLERLLRLGLGAAGGTAPPALVEELRPPRVVSLRLPSG